MEKLSKILLVCLIICLVIIGGYFAYMFRTGYKIQQTEIKCMNFCRSGEEPRFEHVYTIQGKRCLCYDNKELIDIREMDWDYSFDIGEKIKVMMGK